MSAESIPQKYVTITFRLSKAEFVKGKRRGYLRSTYTWPISIVAIVAAVFYASHLSSRGSTAWYWPLIVVAIALFVLVVVSPGRTWDRSAALRDPRTITLDDLGLQLAGSFPTRERAWSGYRSIFEYDDMYVLHYRDNSTTIPKVAFGTASAEARFRELMESHVRCHFKVPS